MTKLKFACFITITIFISKSVNSQPASDSLNYPRVNRPCPDFILKNIKYFPKIEAQLIDFKGKWLLLSFWNKHCAACIASFPRENEWYLKYVDKMQFLSVAIQDEEKQIEPLFLRYKQRENLRFPVAYDSSLAGRWQIYAGPYFILIDPNGIVKARCYLSSRLLEAFMDGKSPKVPPYNKEDHYDFEQDQRIPFDEAKPFFTSGNGGADSGFVYRSLISEFDCMTQQPSKPKPFIDENSDIEGYGTGKLLSSLKYGMFQVAGVPLVDLYSYAWLGAQSSWWINKLNPKSFAEKIELRVRDSSLFNYGDCENQFSYSLKLPASKACKEKVMHIMQQDLENYFGFTAAVEDLTTTTWKLVVSDKEKLQTKGGKPAQKTTSHTEDYAATNIPWTTCFKTLFEYYLPDLQVMDSTGITGNVDINLHCSFMQIESVKKALKENGLELVPVASTRKVLVIHDLK